MPPFAQAEGQNCSLCHTMMPGLNAYGRYILRTFYGAITWDTFHGTSPAWINYTFSGNSTGKLDPKAPGFKNTWGNVQADVAGLMGGGWSYRIEQTLYSNNQGGGSLGQTWIAYTNLLKGDGQIRIGKFGRPVAAVFSNNWYRTGMSLPGITAGAHKYALSSSAWGSEFSYEHGNFAGEAGYYWNNTSWPNGQTFSTLAGTQRTVSYQFAYATPRDPLEVGIYGSTGTFTQSKDPVPQDQFTGNGIYVMRDADPRRYIPGVALVYQVTTDNNPGLVGKVVVPPGTTRAEAFQIEEPLFQGRAMIGARREIDHNLTQVLSGNVFDVGVQVPYLPYLFAYGEIGMGSLYTTTPHAQPTYKWGLRWAFPVIGPLTKIEK